MASLGYSRVSTSNQTLDQQHDALNAAGVERIFDDVMSGARNDRPGLTALLDYAPEGDTVTVVALDRLSRSLLDFASLMARAQRDQWNLVALDLGIDLSTPAGEFMASVMASAAQWESRIIGQRTKDALAVKRAEGVRLGRPTSLAPDVVARILAAREAGRSFNQIAGPPQSRTNPDGSGWCPVGMRRRFAP
jgi:DNA invertase Pin-like site-specific DNA recombinase